VKLPETSPCQLKRRVERIITVPTNLLRFEGTVGGRPHRVGTATGGWRLSPHRNLRSLMFTIGHGPPTPSHPVFRLGSKQSARRAASMRWKIYQEWGDDLVGRSTSATKLQGFVLRLVP
jgi:hypothetical protein